ncbi:hypothetical protein Acy02nite_39640 [Actinoplanes cyaneus]|uniref:Uncharacterized protein n=1 Tax=Actinoplanes cyaneus TaxID=52696 RepID=A0A919M6B2_9ACTN|nr:hypothetical protein [Actinoplanes cyaneus]GID66083.1 hypothetical protein Acy02nite_39640 [Actinoplanes cyaneus]
MIFAAGVSVAVTGGGPERTLRATVVRCSVSRQKEATVKVELLEILLCT